MKQFTLSKSQCKKLKKWQKGIKKKHGEYGLYTYCFTPSGIGDCISVQSRLTLGTLYLTEYDKW